MVLIAEVLSLRVTQRFSLSRNNLLVLRLGRNLRLLLLFECETLFPTITLFPVNSQTLDIAVYFTVFTFFETGRKLRHYL